MGQPWTTVASLLPTLSLTSSCTVQCQFNHFCVMNPMLVLCVRSHCPYPLLRPLTNSDLLTVETAADFYQTMSLLSAHLKKGKIVSTKEFMEVSNVMQDCWTSNGHAMFWLVHVVCTLPLVVESHPTHKYLNPSFTMHHTHTNSPQPSLVHALPSPPFPLLSHIQLFCISCGTSDNPFLHLHHLPHTHSLPLQHPITPYLIPCSCCTSTLTRWTTLTTTPFLPPRTSGSGTHTTLSHLRQSSHLIPVQ